MTLDPDKFTPFLLTILPLVNCKVSLDRIFILPFVLAIVLRAVTSSCLLSSELIRSLPIENPIPAPPSNPDFL